MTMVSSDSIAALRGITTALATPLDADGALDVKALERLITAQIEGGIACLFPLGWCGEGPLLPDAVRRDMILQTCRITDGRIPVMAGVSEHSLPRALELVRCSEDAGADFILATPPFSYEIPGELVEDYFLALASSTRLPIVIYENGEIGVLVGADSLERLSRKDSIIGVKATVPADALSEYRIRLEAPGNFVVISGDEYLFDFALLQGITHFTMGGPGNFSSRWCVRTQRLADEERWTEVLERQSRFVAFLREIYATSATAYGVTKYMLSRLGLCSDHITSPHRPLTEAEKRKADVLMEKNGEFFE